MITREQARDTLEQVAGRYSNERLKINASTIDAWHSELINVKPMQIDKAIGKLGREFEKFPPSAMAFKRLCYQNDSGDASVRRCGRGGCPLTLSQADHYACTYHERVDTSRDSEVLARMRTYKLDVAFCFWLHDASPCKVMEPELFSAPDWAISTMQQYPRGDGETIADYKNRVRQVVDVLVLGEIPLRGPAPTLDVDKQESLKPASEYEQLAGL